MRPSELRLGDIVRDPAGKAFVVADVRGEQVTVTRSQVLTVLDGWELVSRSMGVQDREQLLAKIAELEAGK